MSIFVKQNETLVPLAPSVLFGADKPENTIGMNGDLFFVINSSKIKITTVPSQKGILTYQEDKEAEDSKWELKTWNNQPSSFTSNKIWIDGENVYYSDGSIQYVLNKTINTWETKTWNGFTEFNGSNIWTDGENIYYSDGSIQYVLNKLTDTWNEKNWNNNPAYSYNIWTDGDNIYNAVNKVLNKATSSWDSVSFDCPFSLSFVGAMIWTDGNNIYYSQDSTQYVLDKTTKVWNSKTWNGLTNFNGAFIWTDGNDIYYSNSSTQYVLDKATDTWNLKTWNGLTNFNGSGVWTDGNNIYYSNNSDQYQLIPKGISQSPEWNNYDTNKMTIGGDTSGINAGNYTAIFTPKKGFCWEDDSETAKEVVWTINKAAGNITLSKNSIELSDNNPSDTITFSGNTGAVSVSSNNESIATASINGNVITIAKS